MASNFKMSITFFLLDRRVAAQTALIMAATTIALTCGALFSTILTAPLAARTPRLETRGRATLWLLAAVAGLPVALGLLFAGALYSREEYSVATTGSLLGGAFPLLTVVGLAASGYLIRRGPPPLRFLAIALATVETLMLFSTAGRLFALAPVALALGAYTREPDRFGKSLLAASVAASLLLLPIPLYLRGEETHGLSNYVPALSSLPYGWTALRDAVGNLVLGFGITGITALKADTDGFDEIATIGLDKIAISLNPLPGRLSGWYEISDQLRIGEPFPYSAIGEAWNASIAVALALFFSIGALVGYLDYRVRWLLLRGRTITALSLCGLVVLFALLVTSYNLRSSVRPLWYAIGLDLVVRVRDRKQTGDAETRARLRKLMRHPS